MTSITSTPAEIWQCILQYVINVPVFLDPDGVSIRPTSSMSESHIYNKKSLWNDERPYWSSERDRNVCRRVCRSWDVYLSESVGHRFARMMDIFQGNLPMSSLENTIRISIHPYDLGRVQAPEETIYTKPEWYNSADILLDGLSQAHGIKAKIITAPYITFFGPHITAIATKFPNIITLFSGGLEFGSGDAIHNLPLLRHIYTNRYRSLTPHVGLQSNHLTTLSFRLRHFVPEKWDLPALQTLRIIVPDHGSWEETILPTLRVLGKPIRSLSITVRCPPAYYAQVLEACPKLEHLLVHGATDEKIILPDMPQIHTLVRSHFSPWTPRPTRQGCVWPGWPSVRTVVFDLSWDEARWKETLKTWGKRWKGSLVRIEDNRGVTIEDWVENRMVN